MNRNRKYESLLIMLKKNRRSKSFASDLLLTVYIYKMSMGILPSFLRRFTKENNICDHTLLL